MSARAEGAVAWGRAEWPGVALGDGAPVAVMGSLNVSPESFYSRSVYVEPDALLEAALGMVEAGAALIDVGARSTAPYLPTALEEGEECERLERAVRVLAATLDVPISADTSRAAPARAALEAGARVINDVSGLRDPELGRLVAAREVGLIAMASPAAAGPLPDGPLATVTGCLGRSLEQARTMGIAEQRVVLDPGIGFFRAGPMPWSAWDVEILAHLERLLVLGRPLAVALSRKSFIGALTDRPSPADRLAGSLAATALAVAHGASLIRTHDVRETRDAVRVASQIREARTRAAR
ncbi:MAG: dihydropteroate synthase [Candidatus Rokuibacteriota bacterium]